MSLEQEIRKAARDLLGSYVSPSFPYADVARRLEVLASEHSITLSGYGYVMWSIDHHGYKCAYKNLMASQAALKGYADDAVKYRDDMPVLLLNAHTYVSSILANIPDIDLCLKQLEGMSFPYVLYVLFAGSGDKETVARYRPEAEEQIRRYPSTLDRLPESYRNVGKEILDADAE